MKTDTVKINIFSYTVKSLKRNFNKGIVITIALSVLLISGVLNGLYLFKVQTENLAVSLGTDYHTQIHAETYEQYVFLVNRIENEKVIILYDISATGYQTNELTDGIKIKCVGHYRAETSYQNFPKPEEPFPAQISDALAEQMRIKNEVGTEFSLYVKFSSGETKPVKFILADTLNHGGEFDNTKYVGADVVFDDTIYADNDFFLAFDSEFQSSSEMHTGDFFDPANRQSTISRSVAIQFKKSYDPKPTAARIAAEAGIAQDNMNFNDFYLSIYNNYGRTTVAVVFILALIVFTGAIVIYNIFNILIVKKVNQLGLLRIIGASKNQIRSHIYCEALIYTIFGLPIGLVLGTLTTAAVVPYLKYLDNTFEFALNFSTYLTACVVAVITVAFGVIKPAFKASRISPVEAVKFSGTVPQNKTKKTRKKFFSKITMPVLAKINLSRNKNRTGLIVLSLSMSGILFLVITSVLLTMYTSLDKLFGESDLYDIKLSVYDVLSGYGSDIENPENEITDENFEKLKNIQGVQKIYRTAQRIDQIDRIHYDNDKIVYAYDDELLQAQLDAIPDCKVTLEDLKHGQFLCFYEKVPTSYKKLYENGNNINFSNDKITISDGKLQLKYLTQDYVSMSDVEIAYLAPAVLCVYDVGYQPVLVTSIDTFENLGLSYDYYSFLLKIDTQYHDEIKDAVYGIFYNVVNPNEANSVTHMSSSDPSYPIRFYSIYEQMEGARTMMLGVIVISLTIVFIITLVGIMNLVNIIVIGIEQRTKELGTLSAIGMSGKDISRLLLREIMNISVKSTLISVICGVIGGYLLILFFKGIGADYMTYRFPLAEIIIIGLLYWLVPVIVTNRTIKNLHKKNITEMLRME